MSFESRLIAHLVPFVLRMRHTRLYQVVSQTLILLFPFVLIGSFSQIIQQSILERNGFFAQVFDMAKWLPYYQHWHVFFDNLTNLTIGFAAVIAAYGAARYTAQVTHQDAPIAGVTGMITFLMLSYRPNPQGGLLFTTTFFSVEGILLAMLVGSITGLLFKWLSRTPVVTTTPLPLTTDSLSRMLSALLPMATAFLLAVILNILAGTALYTGVADQLQSSLTTIYQAGGNLVVLGLLGLLSTVAAWMGWSGPLGHLALAQGSGRAQLNLNAALSHHSPWNVPYPFTGHTLYDGFATFGGTGATLALIIAIFLVSRNRNQHLVARWSLLPGLFNLNAPLMTGIPLFFSPTYLIPFILVPQVSMWLAALTIQFKWMPPIVYPIPNGTPGLLIPYIGTNGNWVSLLIALIILAVGVLIYIPFVHLNEAVGQAIIQEQSEEVLKS